MKKKQPIRRPGYKCIGTLPPGRWKFCLLKINGDTDVIVAVDESGYHEPRMVISGKLVEL